MILGSTRNENDLDEDDLDEDDDNDDDDSSQPAEYFEPYFMSNMVYILLLNLVNVVCCCSSPINDVRSIHY